MHTNDVSLNLMMLLKSSKYGRIRAFESPSIDSLQPYSSFLLVSRK